MASLFLTESDAIFVLSLTILYNPAAFPPNFSR
jgi:hypothetical protein